MSDDDSTEAQQEPDGADAPRSKSRAAGQAALTAASLTGRAIAWVSSRARGRVVEIVGGPARARVITIFGGVLALSTAQIATVGAVAPQLEQSLHIGNTRIGLLNSVALVVGALAVVPVGLLVDRFRRIPMLAASMLLWSAMTFLGAFASSYSTLLLTRLGLGAVTATAGPAIASLTGDYFPAVERSRVYGYILSGEIAGTAAGFVISGTVASVFSWRVAFFLLGIPGLALARSLWRTVPEPRRGGQSWLALGTIDLNAAARGHRHGQQPQQPTGATPPESGHGPGPGAGHAEAFEAFRERGFEPNPELVLDRDPDEMPLAAAVRYVLRIPTNVHMIISSSLGYFFLAGLQTFAVVFIRGHYQASEATATLMLGLLVVGALVGTLVSGPLTDMIARRGTFEARVWVPAICFLAAVVALIPGLLSSTLAGGIWFDVAGAALISAANPPLDAARLDIMPSGLWGRAESIRTFLRSLAQAFGPLLFGVIADLVSGLSPQQAPLGTHTHQIVSSRTGTGLQVSFLVMLVTLGAAGVFLLRARRTYPTDVATAGASWNPAHSPPTTASPTSMSSP